MGESSSANPTGHETSAETHAEPRCPIKTVVEEATCGRPLHLAPVGVDREPVCLMHSNDPAKHSGTLNEAFFREFQSILKDAGEGEAHFDRFVFPELNLSRRTLLPFCNFSEATFAAEANFNKATFTALAVFYRATFTLKADFTDATFEYHARFGEAAFRQNANFNGVTYTRIAEYRGATFAADAHFTKAIFMKYASFKEATFGQKANFSNAKFAGDALFDYATFKQDADFHFVTFNRDAIFVGTTFTGTVEYDHTKFRRVADWSYASFLGKAEFLGTSFATVIEDEPWRASARFWRPDFYNPKDIIFDDVDLSRVSFRDCDLSEVRFTSSVVWGRRNNRKAVVYEEPLDQDPSISAVSQIYQQLKKNYDAQLDYWTANEFHFGEMEMKRLAAPTKGRLLGLRRWWHRNLGMIALYRWGSDYGNNYVKPILWLLGVLVLFAALFPLSSIEFQQALPCQPGTYGAAWHTQDSGAQKLRSEAGLLGKSLLMAIDIATFQRNSEYTPSYPWGRALAIAENLLTSTLFALFLLAMRRQFRR